MLCGLGFQTVDEVGPWLQNWSFGSCSGSFLIIWSGDCGGVERGPLLVEAKVLEELSASDWKDDGGSWLVFLRCLDSQAGGPRVPSAQVR